MTNARYWILLGLLSVSATPVFAQSFRVQCPEATVTHPSNLTNLNAEPAYKGATTQAAGPNGYLVPSAKVNGTIVDLELAAKSCHLLTAPGPQVESSRRIGG